MPTWALLALVQALIACGNATPLRVDGPRAGGEPARAPAPGRAPEPDAMATPEPQPEAGIDCAAVTVRVERVTPKVMLLIDGSSSMQDNFYPPESKTTRWEALRSALLGANGVVPAMQDRLKLGLAVFGSGQARFGAASAKTCPFPVEVVAPALDQGAQIARSWPAMPPGTFTPTGQALELLLRRLETWRTLAAEPEVIVLATDGNPNDCSPQQFVVPDYQPTIDAAMHARAQQIKLYVISLGTDADRAHLQQVANVGAGVTPDAQPGAPLYYPENVEQLTATLRDLLASELSCELMLSGEGVDPKQECKGSVRLNGDPVACEPENGFRVKDPTHLELLGAACARLRAAADIALDVTFPCEALR